MRPIGWGLLVFIASGMVWIVSSFMFGVSLAIEGTEPEMPILFISWAIFFFSLPVAIVAELVRWYMKRRRVGQDMSPLMEKATFSYEPSPLGLMARTRSYGKTYMRLSLLCTRLFGGEAIDARV